jgi:hypothetical protein
MSRLRALAVALALITTPALAQTPVRIDGTIASASPDRLEVKTDDGNVAVALPANVRIGAVKDRTLDSIKPGEFIASAALRGRDGKLHAQEVRIFPESMRGRGEGHRPMSQPEQTMTNATVDGVATAPGGRDLHVRYPGGEQTIEVDPGVRVVELIAGDRSLLVPGASVSVRATESGGALTAVSVQAEKDGVKPPP